MWRGHSCLPCRDSSRHVFAIALCHILFPELRIRQEGWGGPPGPRGSPWTRSSLSKNQVIATLDKPARGPAADRGVRPTICPGARFWKKYVALGSQTADSTLVSSLVPGSPPSVEASLDVAA